MKQIRHYDDGRVTLVQKIRNIESFQNIILSCICHTLSLISTGYAKVSLFEQLKLEGYSERAMKKRFINSSLSRSQGGHVMLSSFFQPRYSTVLNEKSNNLLPTFSICAAVNYYSVTVPQKREF